MPESDKAGPKVGADIPYFFYDIIARIIPGAFLIVGVILTWNGQILIPCVLGKLGKIGSSESSAGIITLLVTVCLLVFVCVSAFLGFLIASISNITIEKGLFHWWPLDIAGLGAFLGLENINDLRQQFKKQFGSEFADHAINRSSFLCAYHVWKIDANLGAMTGRHDAELLAAQSVFMVGLVLVFAVVSKGIVYGFGSYLWNWLGSLALITIGACLTFQYHRKKRVYSRFALFLAVIDRS